MSKWDMSGAGRPHLTDNQCRKAVEFDSLMSHQMTNKKFADTNMTFDMFVSGLRKFSFGASNLLYGWSDIEPDLQEEYLENLRWMLDKAADYIEETGNKIS